MEHNGKQFTTVTTVLQFCNGYGHIPANILQVAADRGQRAHSAIAARLKGLGSWGEDEDIQGYLKSFELISDRISDIQLIEHRFFDDERLLTGQLDMIARLDGILYVIDWKTSLRPNKTFPLQAAAYWQLSQSDATHACMIQLKKDGTKPNFYHYWPEELPTHWEIFLKCYDIHKLFFEGKEREDFCFTI